MSFWDKRPLQFRILLMLLSALMLVFIFINFYRNATATITGTYYVQLFSQIYVIKDIAASRESESDAGKDYNSIDTIHAGSFILEINGQKVYKYEDFIKLLESEKNSEYIYLTVLNSDSNEIEQYRIYVNYDIMSKLTPVLNGVVVQRVGEGGASDRAGIRPGDILYSIDGRVLTEDFEALKYLRSQQSGRTLIYRIIRADKVIDFKLELATYGIKFSYLSVFIIGLMFITLALFLGLKRPRLIAARLSSMTMLIVGFMIASGFDLNPPNFDFFSTFRFYLHQIVYFSILPLIFHSLYYFPKEISGLKRKFAAISIPYIISIISFGLITYAFFSKVDLLLKYVVQIYLVIMTVYFITFYIIQRIKRVSKEPVRSSAIHFAYFLNLIVMGLLSVLSNVASLMRNDFFILLFDYSAILMIMIPVSYIYVIWRYRLLDLEIRVKRNIQYTAFSLVIAAIMIGAYLGIIMYLSTVHIDLPNIHFTGTSLEVIDKPLSPNLQNIYGKLIFGFIGLLVTIFFIKLRLIIQSLLDRSFYRVHFDYRRAATEFATVIEENRTLSSLTGSIANKLGTLLQFKRIGVIFFRGDQRLASQEYFGFDDKLLREFNSLICPELIESASLFKGSFSVDYLPENIKKIYKECKFNFIIPINSKDNLLGLFLIGEKQSESELDTQDIELLRTLASQSSVAIENALLYEDLAKQERIRHELDIARRIQLASLPQGTPVIKGLDIAGISLPALEVGGDFYDYLNGSENEFTVIVGDVSGKGTSAALYMSKAQGIMRTLYDFSASPYDLFIKTNRLLYKYLEKSYFITAIGVRIDVLDKSIKVSRAGHIPLFLHRLTTGKVEKIIPKGLVLGLTEDDLFDRNLEEQVIGFSDGDGIIFVTDGILEARNDYNEEFGYERLIDIIERHSDKNSVFLRDEIIRSVQSFATNTEQFDDMTVVVIKFNSDLN